MTSALVLASSAPRGVLGSSARGGFFGVYHSATGTVNDGKQTSAFDALDAPGVVAMYNAPSDGGVTFAEQVKFHCVNASSQVNLIFGMVVGFSEGGVFNNPNDTSILEPLEPAGMLQAAARWSTLAKTCPQVTGIVLDDVRQPVSILLPRGRPIHAAHLACSPGSRQCFLGSFGATMHRPARLGLVLNAQRASATFTATASQAIIVALGLRPVIASRPPAPRRSPHAA
mgnify:CR=1 FL=1